MISISLTPPRSKADSGVYLEDNVRGNGQNPVDQRKRSIYWDICLAFIAPEAAIKAFKQAFYRIYPQVAVGSIV